MTQQIYSLKLIIFVISNHNTCILASEMASPGNQHCANCIGTLSFPISNAPVLDVVHELVFSSVQFSSCEHAFKQRNAILAAISGGSVYRPLSAFKAQDIDARKYAIYKLSPGGAARRYAPTRRWQFDSRRIYVRLRTGPQSARG